MKKLRWLIPLLFIPGCCSVEGTRSADGSLSIRSTRVFWASEGIDFSLTDTNRITTSLKVQKSSTDSTAIANVFTGLQNLGITAAKP